MSTRPLPVVMGDLDLTRPLSLAGMRSVVVCARDDPARFSRFTIRALDRDDPSLLERLLALAAGQPARPILFYGNDRDLLFVSDHRDELLAAYDTLLPPREVVDDLLDKARFQRLAEQAGLPVPRTQRIDMATRPSAADLEVSFPVIVKPLTRAERWWNAVGWAKAQRVDDAGAWSALVGRLADAGVDVLVQELVPGGEERIESYHAYLNWAGEVVGEFTGAKIRTRPAEFGYSTALVTTAEDSVCRAGRDVLARIGYGGVAKVDFKRAPDGRLYLLEINPRLSLWVHLGAIAGVNLPALVYRELTGTPMPGPRTARAGVHWCDLRQDAGAVRESGGSLLSWLPWALRCEAKSATSLGDPMPLLRGKLWPRVTRGRALR